MVDILTPEEMAPRIVTLRDLRRALLPYCHGWRWAEDAIVDLWELGAPVPNPGKEEQRILLPSQFKKWWLEVAERMGIQHVG